MTSTQTQTAVRPRRPGPTRSTPPTPVCPFTARHLMVSKVRGRFARQRGHARRSPRTRAQSSVDATIDVQSVESGDPKRDEHLRSADFFDAEHYPTITFRSTKVEDHGDGEFTLIGDLTVRGRHPAGDASRASTSASSQSPWDTTVVGFTAETEVNRKDWGLEWNMALEAGGVLVGDKITLTIDAEAVLQDS